MQEKRKALGKGLEQLFSNESFNLEQFEHNNLANSNNEDVVMVNIDELRSNPYQPRTFFDNDKLNELAESIKQYGVVEPIIVKKSIKGYEIIAGERRTLASKKAGLKEIPAIIREFTDDEMLEIAILENIQREDLNVIEEAKAYKNMIDTLNITQEELGKRLGKSRSYVTNVLGLLTLPDKIQTMVLEKKLSMSHARTLSKLQNEDEIFDLADKIINNNLSVRDIENKVSSSPRKKPLNTNFNNTYNPYTLVQSSLREKIGSMVKVNNRNIVIPFSNQKDLERILEILNVKVDLDE